MPSFDSNDWQRIADAVIERATAPAKKEQQLPNGALGFFSYKEYDLTRRDVDEVGKRIAEKVSAAPEIPLGWSRIDYTREAFVLSVHRPR